MYAALDIKLLKLTLIRESVFLLLYFFQCSKFDAVGQFLLCFTEIG